MNRIISLIKFKNKFSSRKLFAALKSAKDSSSDFLIFSDLFKVDENAIHKFNSFQTSTIDSEFLTQIANIVKEANSLKIKIGYSFNLTKSFSQKEIRDNREYLIGFFNFLKFLGAASFYFEDANELPKEFLVDFFSKIKGVYVFGSTSLTNSISLSDFDLYHLGFNALQPRFLEINIDKYIKDKTKANLNYVANLIDFDTHYFKNFYRIFKIYRNEKIISILSNEKFFKIIYKII